MTVGELLDELKSCGLADEVFVSAGPREPGAGDEGLLKVGYVAAGNGRVVLDAYSDTEVQPAR